MTSCDESLKISLETNKVVIQKVLHLISDQIKLLELKNLEKAEKLNEYFLFKTKSYNVDLILPNPSDLFRKL